jgi:hypothetical protein
VLRKDAHETEQKRAIFANYSSTMHDSNGLEPLGQPLSFAEIAAKPETACFLPAETSFALRDRYNRDRPRIRCLN